MCFTKVANPSRDRDDERAATAGQGNETDDQRDLIEEWLLFEPVLFSQQHQQPQQQQRRGGGGSEGIVAASTQMLFRLDREREMSTMVSALTHVVAGEEQTRLDEINCLDSSAGSGSWGGVGNKRGREEGGGGGQMSSESVTRLCRAFGEFPQQNTSSSSVSLLPGNFLFIYFIFTFIFSYLIYFYNN